MNAIRARDAEIHIDEYGLLMGEWWQPGGWQPGDLIAEDRRALLAAGDALAEAELRTGKHVGEDLEPGCEVCIAISAWKEATDG